MGMNLKSSKINARPTATESLPKKIILEGAIVNKHGGSDNSTALMVAAFQGHLDIVEILANKGAKINAFDKDGISALGFAAFRGHCDILRGLLSSRANINDSSNDGHTPLMMAAYNGKIDAVKLLLMNGASINIRSIRGKTAADYAKEMEHFQVAALTSRKESEASSDD